MGSPLISSFLVISICCHLQYCLCLKLPSVREADAEKDNSWPEPIQTSSLLFAEGRNESVGGEGKSHDPSTNLSYYGTRATNKSAAQSHRGSKNIDYRSGGFPKFPNDLLIYKASSAEFGHTRSAEAKVCGERRIFHDMERKSISRDGKIIGGSPVPYGAYPWTANIKLRYGNSWLHHCGGTIISRYFVLTAAHCVERYKPKDFLVTVGDNDRAIQEDDEKSFKVVGFRIHPDFKIGGTYMNDIAVLKLENPGVGNKATVSAACLPTRLTPYTHGTFCYISGWGLTNVADLENKPDRLQAASVPLLSAEVCMNAAVHGSERIGPGMVCAGYLQGMVDACGGDSGGPLVCEVNGSFYALGIVSWGSSCARPNKPGVYTKVQFYVDWIHDVMEEM